MLGFRISTGCHALLFYKENRAAAPLYPEAITPQKDLATSTSTPQIAFPDIH
jgi:hypothetical protein